MLRMPLVICVALLLFGGCAPGTAAPASTSAKTTTTTTTTVPQHVLPVGFESWSAVGIVDAVVVHTAPSADAPVIRTFGRTNLLGHDPPVFGVYEERLGANRTTWLRALVPEVKPNGTQGWLRASDVSVRGHNQKIMVDLGAHTATFFENGLTVGTWQVGIGKPSAQTPRGRFFVWTKFLPEQGSPPVYGPGVLGISAMSEALDKWLGSSFPLIGLHGTRRESDLGNDVSNGCIRMPYDATTLLLERVELGTPVEIV